MNDQTSNVSNKFEGRESLDFSLFHITERESKKIAFEERLQLVNDTGTVVDEVTISVEPSASEEGGFEVLQHSVDENLMLRTRSHVTNALETISEIRKIRQNETAKLLRITSLPDEYRLFMVETNVEQWTGSRANHEWAKAECKPMVLEGANVLLLRKLAFTRHYGRFTAMTVDHDGVLCEARYTVEYLTHGEVQVTRAVGSETMTTVLSPKGRILFHKWSTSRCRLESGLSRMRLHSRQDEGDGDRGSEESKAEPEPVVDLPAYWQKKEEVKEHLAEYMVENSDVQDMMADLMKNMLFEKPDDPIDFADTYLSEFMGIPRDTDTESEDVQRSVSEFSE